MYSAGVVSKIKTVQTGFKYLALLQFSAFLWPPAAVVEDGASFDYIIVGAGTAGSVIAHRLTEDETVNVLLIEAGGDAPVEAVLPGCLLFLKRSKHDWNYTTENDEFTKKCHQKPYFEPSSGKMLGGTSSMNYMLYSQGHPTDYNIWANITNDPTWEWKNVYQFFEKNMVNKDSVEMTNFYTQESANGILKSFNDLGNYTKNDPENVLGYSRALLYIDKGGRQSSAFRFLNPAKDRKNLHVLKNTLVSKINFDEKKNAIGVEAILETGKTINIKALKEVIVSAGTFNSAKLLMLSGIGPKEDLERKNINVISDLPVGKNLHDHIGVVINYAMEKRNQTPLDPNRIPAVAILGYTALGKDQIYPDYETMSFSSHANLILFFCSFGYRLSYDICDNTFVTMMGRMGLFNEIVNLHPNSRGEVTLRSSNPMDPPVIKTGYFTDESDLDNLVKYVKNFVHVGNTPYFKSVEAEMIDPIKEGCSEFKKYSDEYWKCYISCMFSGIGNYVGTCAMGSVVDSRLKVLGVQKLRVADASIMPVITRGNTYAPVVVIGEKAAEFIKEESDKINC